MNLLIGGKPIFYKVAERVGFEPTVACATSVFKTDAIDHSATSPWCVCGVSMREFFARIKKNLFCEIVPAVLVGQIKR